MSSLLIIVTRLVIFCESTFSSPGRGKIVIGSPFKSFCLVTMIAFRDIDIGS